MCRAPKAKVVRARTRTIYLSDTPFAIFETTYAVSVVGGLRTWKKHMEANNTGLHRRGKLLTINNSSAAKKLRQVKK